MKKLFQDIQRLFCKEEEEILPSSEKIQPQENNLKYVVAVAMVAVAAILFGLFFVINGRSVSYKQKWKEYEDYGWW